MTPAGAAPHWYEQRERTPVSGERANAETAAVATPEIPCESLRLLLRSVSL